MPNNLGWADDANWFDFTHWLKEQFAMEIPEEDCPAIENAGDVYDAVMLYRPTQPLNRKCASAMSFYRLRQALTDIRNPQRISPATPLAAVDPALLQRALKGIGTERPLHVPTAHPDMVSRILMTTTFYAAIGLFLMTIVEAFPPHNMPLALMVALIIIVSFGIVFWKRYPKREPEDCATVGDLAKRIAAYNLGRFVTQGARMSDDEIWDAVREALAEFAVIPKAEITRETVFF